MNGESAFGASKNYTDEHGGTGDAYTKQETNNLLANKVDKVSGKDLSKNDYSDEEKQKVQNANSHLSNTSNPHNVTKNQVGLANVDNTSDMDKPVSNATKTELDKKIDDGTGGITKDGTKLKHSNSITAQTTKKLGLVSFDAQGHITGFTEVAIIDNLTTNDSSKLLSAKQGKVLQDTKLNISGGNITGNLTVGSKSVLVDNAKNNSLFTFTAVSGWTVNVQSVYKLSSNVYAVKITVAGNIGSTSTEYYWGTNVLIDGKNIVGAFASADQAVTSRNVACWIAGSKKGWIGSSNFTGDINALCSGIFIV